MNSALARRFEELEAQRQTLLNTLAPHPWRQLTLAPPGQWSAVQVLAHLVTAENLSVAYMKKKIQGINETTATGLVEDLRMLLLICAQRLPLRFKAPAMVVDKTPDYPTLEALVGDWDAVRAELKGLLEQIPPGLLKRKIYKHAVAGRVNIVHALVFFREHIIHHKPQLRRLLAKAHPTH
jgi:hypothetical protein